MKLKLLCAILIPGIIVSACESNPAATTADKQTKTILLHQLQLTHNKKDWFVPISGALDGVTAEQAVWRDSSDNHSIGQLTYHLLFWNKRQLARFNGRPEGEFSGNNDETFNAFTKESWEHTRVQLDSVMTALEKAIAEADESKLVEWYPTIANISAHNAYHTGQIVSTRRLQKSWDPEKGVK
jgi:hypothetical protein